MRIQASEAIRGRRAFSECERRRVVYRVAGDEDPTSLTKYMSASPATQRAKSDQQTNFFAPARLARHADARRCSLLQQPSPRRGESKSGALAATEPALVSFSPEWRQIFNCCMRQSRACGAVSVYPRGSNQPSGRLERSKWPAGRPRARGSPRLEWLGSNRRTVALRVTWRECERHKSQG